MLLEYLIMCNGFTVCLSVMGAIVFWCLYRFMQILWICKSWIGENDDNNCQTHLDIGLALTMAKTNACIQDRIHQFSWLTHWRWSVIMYAWPATTKKKLQKKWLSRCCLWSLRWCEWWFVCFVFCSNLKKNLFDAISKALYGEKGKNGIFNGKFMVNLPLYVSLKRPKKQFSHFFSLLLLTVLLRLFKNWLI